MTATLLTIALLHWAILLVPGFNFVLIGQLAAGGARGKALAAVAGMVLSTLSWALLAVLGVGVVFTAHPLLRLAVQVAGGLYLLQMAWRLWGTRRQPVSTDGHALSSAGAFRAGFLTSILNRKIALFYGSVFATALPAQPSLALSASAVGMVLVNSLVWHVFLALALSQPAVQRIYLRSHMRINQACCAVVGAFGLRVLLTTLQELRAKAA